MNAGYYISGAGHAGLIGLLLFGGVPSSDPVPIEVSEVSIISNEEFAMLTATRVPPQIDAVQPQVPQAPDEVAPDIPGVPIQDDPPPSVVAPDVVEAVEPDTAPDAPEVAPPVPADVTDVAPILPTPEIEAPPPLPKTSVRPKVRPARRVAPTPIVPPEPDTAVDDVVREAALPDTAAQSQSQETQSTAPQEASDRIATEDNQADENSSAAPTRSARPRMRPKPPTKPTNAASRSDALQAALAEAAETDAPSENAPPSGPPLSSGETDALRLAVSSCWNVGSLSSDALRSIVVIGFSMQENGKPVTSSIRLISSSGGSGSAAQQAYETARRAIIRCGARGYNLPIEKYDHWREIEMTFNPEKMRIK